MTKQIKMCDRCKTAEHPKVLFQATRRFWLICEDCSKEISKWDRPEQYMIPEKTEEAG